MSRTQEQVKQLKVTFTFKNSILREVRTFEFPGKIAVILHEFAYKTKAEYMLEALKLLIHKYMTLEQYLEITTLIMASDLPDGDNLVPSINVCKNDHFHVTTFKGKSDYILDYTQFDEWMILYIHFRVVTQDQADKFRAYIAETLPNFPMGERPCRDLETLLKTYVNMDGK